MFFGVSDAFSKKVSIGYATSQDLSNWNYEKIIIEEDFPVNNPYVFQVGGEYYLIPSTPTTKSVRLYKAKRFPSEWSYITDLIQGTDLRDPSILRYKKAYYMFAEASGGTNSALRLYYSKKLTGPWKEHPKSPVVSDNADIARPAGRIVEYNNKLYRYAQDDSPTFGKKVWAFEITALTPTMYTEEPVGKTPVLAPDGQGWNSKGMHHIDASLANKTNWVICVDGRGEFAP